MDPSHTAHAAAPSASAAMAMDGMGHGGGCRISMLWNWYTVDTCFISSTWHNTSRGMFAGSCIGVLLLTMSLELLRRSVKEYDRFLIRKRTTALALAAATATPTVKGDDKSGSSAPEAATTFTPTIFEQAVRALLHMVQFGVAYFIMLLAMYYNGYIIICILIGAFLGSFVFHWEPISLQSAPQTSASKEATVCCA